MPLLTIASSMSPIRDCPAHSHESWEIVLNLSGEGETTVGETCLRFVAGSILCIPPGVSHGKNAVHGFEDIYFHSSSFPLVREPGKTEAFYFQDDAEKSMETIMRLMQRLYYKDASSGKLVVTSLYRAAMDLLVSWHGRNPVEAVVEQVQDKLIAAFTDPKTDIEALLVGSGYSVDHTRRRFKEFFGVTPGEYLTELRMGYAKQLMAQNKFLRLPLAEISLMCGYYDSHYFSRVFRNKTGVSPKQYLAQLQKENL